MTNKKDQRNKLEKQVVINCEKLETRVALLNNRRLEEYQIERIEENEIVSGSIYLARIVNLEPSLQAAFVDIGAEKNAFLHYWDMLPASYDKAERVEKGHTSDKSRKNKSGLADKLRTVLGKGNKSKKIQERETKRRRKKISVKDIPKLFPKGSEVLVQVTKGPIGTKGARVTTNLSIPGRYLVLLPYADHIGLSSKITDSKERKRLKKILTELDIPEGMGVICRTIGEGRKSVFFKRDLDLLLELWHRVETFMANDHKVPALVYSEPTLTERTVRDFLTEDIDQIIVDNPGEYKSLKGLVSKVAGRKLASKVELYQKSRPVFEYYGVKKQVAEIFKREVPLRSGGYLCIDETEALIAIDVNTGKQRSKKDQPEVILATNLEAADEVARQLRVRNIGGLVVIDFIDMRPAKDREAVLKRMRKLVKQDRAKSKVLPISKLGLMEMSRQREKESLQDTVHDPCPYCEGKGRIKSAMSMSVEIQRRLHEVLKRNCNESDFSVRLIIHPTILARLKNEDSGLFDDLEEKYGNNLDFRADASVHHEEFKIIDPITEEEY